MLHFSRYDFEQAISHGDTGKVKDCLSRGAAVDDSFDEGRLPLHLAAAKGNCELIKLFIESGAYVNATDDMGSTAMHDAATNGHLEATLLLLDYNADVNAADQAYWKPLHCAIRNNHLDLVEVLIAAGKNLLLEDLPQIIPHQFASLHGNNKACELLMTEEIQQIRR